MQQFASDNCAGICPEALQALLAANAGDAPGYGEDDWTRRVSDRLRALFETDCDVYFVFNGTAANSLALISDAVHNLSDVVALLLAWGAAWLSQRRPTDRHAPLAMRAATRSNANRTPVRRPQRLSSRPLPPMSASWP